VMMMVSVASKTMQMHAKATIRQLPPCITAQAGAASIPRGRRGHGWR
jgi:hypothetical protein